MRFWIVMSALSLLPIIAAASLSAQNPGGEQALRDAKAKALVAEKRAESLRQEAANASFAADRLVAQHAVLSAEIDAAAAQIDAAKARIAIITKRQKLQQQKLGAASEPMLRLNAALQQMTNRPTSLMMAQPGQRKDYIHMRAVMETVQPEIARRTAALRQQIVIQKDLQGQEMLALKALSGARTRLATQRTALAKLENSSRGKSDSLTADAAVEFEQAIAQGERARDIIENIDYQRASGERASDLAALEGPLLASGNSALRPTTNRRVYLIPENGKLIAGFNELNATGYRERGITLRLDPSTNISAPAAGKISYAGTYRSYGNIIVLEHGSGWSSLITNLASLNVSQGARVRQGELLGKVRADKPEITLELRRKGRTMDIAALLF